MAALPYQSKLTLPITWSGSTAKTVMQAGSYIIEGTIGFRPTTQTANLKWCLTASEAADLIATLEAGKFNAEYTYTDNVRGTVNLRPVGDYSYTETASGQMVWVTAAMRRI